MEGGGWLVCACMVRTYRKRDVKHGRDVDRSFLIEKHLKLVDLSL